MELIRQRGEGHLMFEATLKLVILAGWVAGLAVKP
jgi:hypothetical protein